uniref:B3 domain-containing protein Os03g0184500-like isoform X2 n=1 Tax=Fragaria vesca subsp. vesca TaxID=101020 RepID=UPI0005C9CC3D|nr:PREDICTED: B3 domain-containing protein Os03g0184500-like isoform X2 [Fragaria vesca subsp. vesca]
MTSTSVNPVSTEMQKKSKNNAKTSSKAPLSLKKHKIVEQSRGTFAEVDISSQVRPNALKVKISPPPSTRPKTRSTSPSTQRIKSTPSIRGMKRKNVLIREKPRNASDAARSAAYEEAKAHQMGLDSKTPSIVKLMVYSHVSRVFWLGLPKDFCDANLVKKKSDITLQDEHGNQFTVVYIPERHGLSGGWKKFAQEKKLHEGDAIVLQRTGPKRLKVHIFRSAELLPKIQAECVSSLEIKKKQRNI